MSRRAKPCARSRTERRKVCWRGPKTTPSYLRRPQPQKASSSREFTGCLISNRTLSSKSFLKVGGTPTLLSLPKLPLRGAPSLQWSSLSPMRPEFRTSASTFASGVSRSKNSWKKRAGNFSSLRPAPNRNRTYFRSIYCERQEKVG